MTDREKLIELLDMNCGYVAEMKAEELADYLISEGAAIPVRCGECRYYEEHTQNNYYCGRAEEFSEIITNWVEPNDFCSYGERKEDDR